MSRYILKGETGQSVVDVILGWDEPMKWFFMVIDGDLDEPLYSNLYEPSPETLTLQHFQTVLDRFSISNISLKPDHPCGLYEKLMTDKTQKNMS